MPLPIKRIQFNTGRLYGKEGQRIVVIVDPQLSSLQFNDIDRGIAGEVTGLNGHTNWVERDDEIIRLAMCLYDTGAFRTISIYPGDDLIWDDAAPVIAKRL